MERMMGFEPTTSTLARLRSTPELHPLGWVSEPELAAMLPYLLKRTDGSVEGAGRTGRCQAAFSGCSGLTSGKAAFCCTFSSAAVLVPCSSNSFPWRRHGGSWRGPAWKSFPYVRH